MCGASRKGPGPRQRRFGFGYQAAHDLGHRQDFLNAARSLSGSEKCLVRPTGLMRRQDLVPQAVAVVTCLLALAAPFVKKWRPQRAQNRAEPNGARDRTDIVENLDLDRILRIGVKDCLLPLL